MVSKQIINEIIMKASSLSELEGYIKRYTESGWKSFGKIHSEGAGIFGIKLLGTENSTPIEIIKEVPIEVIKEIEVPVPVPMDEDYDEQLYQEFLNWKSVHFTDYMGPESSSVEPDEVYDGCKITFNGSSIRLESIQGSIEWGDGSYQTITEESKDRTYNSYGTMIPYQEIIHNYNKGIYTIYLSSDFKILFQNDRNYASEGRGDNAYWSGKIISIGGKVVPDLDFNTSYNGNSSIGTTLILENGIETIEPSALERSVDLTEIEFPTTLSSIGAWAFAYSTSLSSVKIPSNGNLRSIDFCAFANCPIESLILPETIEFLGNSNFMNVKYLKMLKREPLSFESVDNFKGVFSLPSYQPKLQAIYVPYSADHSVLNAYKTATGWSSYANIIFESDPE